MLAQQQALIRQEVEAGTGAVIGLETANSGVQQGLRLWFDDLGRARSPIVELRPRGLSRYEARLSFGNFAAETVQQMMRADDEERQLARALVRSIAEDAQVTCPGQSLDDWRVDGPGFTITAELKGVHDRFGDGHLMAGDIRPFGADPARIPEFDVLLAGFPCQPFSLAGVSKKNSLGRSHGFADETQGNLFFEIERILRFHRPAAFLLENVKHLERHDRGNTFEVIRRTLKEKLGYHIDWRVISSRPWVPQNRERIFIAGFRDDVGFSFEGFQKQIPPPAEWPLLGSVLQSHNEIDSKYTLTPRLWEYLQAYRAKHESAGNGFGYSLFGPDDVTRTLSARYYKDGSEILIRQPGTRPRRLTPLECARLMGFERGERTWDIPVSDMQAYKQFGNAVVVPAVDAIARYMWPSISSVLGAGPESSCSEARKVA